MPNLPPFAQKLRERLPAPLEGPVGHLLSFCAGLLIALVMSYVLYRIGLPSKPFIYVTF